jgi:hypothetical protein
MSTELKAGDKVSLRFGTRAMGSVTLKDVEIVRIEPQKGTLTCKWRSSGHPGRIGGLMAQYNSQVNAHYNSGKTSGITDAVKLQIPKITPQITEALAKVNIGLASLSALTGASIKPFVVSDYTKKGLILYPTIQHRKEILFRIKTEDLDLFKVQMMSTQQAA